MKEGLLNLAQLREELSNTIQDYRTITRKEEIANEELIHLIKTLLVDRELLIEEIDEIKEEQSGLLPIMFRKNRDYKLLVNGVEESVINDLNLLAHKLDIPEGELLSFLMKEAMRDFNGTFPTLSTKVLKPLLEKKRMKITISDYDFLSVSEQDLLETDARISFHNIDNLEFIDVNHKTFMRHIGHITGCGQVRVPRSLSKLLVYAKCTNCGQFEFVD
ncbi:MAG: hypothetical protein ACFFD4_11645 [Candidatus Odinarchaeota archaeon]